jgi:hypothetical protein
MMAEEQARLTIAGKLISILLVLGLIATGIYVIGPTRNRVEVDRRPRFGAEAPQTEAPDTKALPPSANTSTYRSTNFPPLRESVNTSGTPIRRFSFLVQRLGRMAAVIAANHGTKPNRDSVSSKKYGFKVEMVLMDDPSLPAMPSLRGGAHAFGAPST